MYAKGKFYANYFKSEKEPTEKTVFGTISEAIKVGEENGQNVYEFDSWLAYFVGKAYDKAKSLENKTNIKITEWIIRNPYDKEKDRSYPQIRILDFEVEENRNE